MDRLFDSAGIGFAVVRQSGVQYVCLFCLWRNATFVVGYDFPAQM